MPEVSILNDVIGPVMRGPSSSHTAGAYRIARLACALAGGAPPVIRCTFDPDGSYAPTYLPLGVDMAFAAGCLGWEMTDPRYRDALRAAQQAGISIRFDVARLAHADHPNTIRIQMNSGGATALEVWAKSVGGGIVEIYRLDDWPISIDGRCWSILAECSGSDGHEWLRREKEAGDRTIRSTLHESPAGCLLQVDIDTPTAAAWIEQVEALPSAKCGRTTQPVLYPQPGVSGIASSGALLELARREGVSLGAASRLSESRLLQLPEATLTAEILERFAVMRNAVKAGLVDGNVAMPLTGPSAGHMMAAEKDGKLPTGGMLTRAAIRSMACMHTCNSKGVVCAAPTGGSAGVLAGVLVTLEDECHLDAPALARALFAAGGVGLVMAARATFAAETAGCQVEIGVAGAMAAAAVIEARGGTAQQALDAAAIALQNTMGSVCDPVGGGCEIPCHTRNAVAASSAFVCADLVVGGYVNPIPLDETVDASYAVGRALPRELRCTALGGIAIAPSALALVSAATSPLRH